MKMQQIADKLLVELVKVFDEDPASLSERGLGLDIWDLAVRASLIGEQEAKDRRKNYSSGAMDNLPSARQLLVNRGWITTSLEGAYGRMSAVLYPTPEGIDHGHWLMRPLMQKVWDSIKNSAKEITVAIIASVITTVVTYFVLRWITE